MFRVALILTALLYVFSAQAAIVIESVDDDGKKGKVTIDEGRARIDSGALGGYILINLDEGTIFAIDHKERAILDLRSPLLPSSSPHARSSDKPSAPPPVVFRKVGKGPVIAGYATLRYQVNIDGMHCFDEYLSQQLLNEPNVRRFAEIIGKATGSDRQSGMGIPFDPDAPCEAADDLADDYYPKLGIPMRTVGSNGLKTHEITRVDTDASPPVGTFNTPPDYRQMTRAELAERAASRIPQHGQGAENLGNEEIIKLQRQIKQQIERMKQRARNTGSADDATGEMDEPDSGTTETPSTTP